MKLAFTVREGSLSGRYAGLPDITGYEDARPLLYPRLMRRRNHEELLAEVPFRPVLDMALTSCILWLRDGFPPSSSIIRKRLLASWHISEETLWKDTLENAPRITEYIHAPLDELVGRISPADSPPEETDRSCLSSPAPMTVVTNSLRYLGASALLDRSLMDRLSAPMDGSCYILPSSIHEVILVPAVPHFLPRLRRIVREVNRAEVADHDVLSDEVYEWSKKAGRMILPA